MTNTIISTDTVVEGPIRFTAAGDSLWLAPGVLLSSTNLSPIFTSLENISVRIDGAIWGGSTFAVTAFGGGSKMAIGSTGSISGTASGAAVLLRDGDGSLINDGSISGLLSRGVTTTGENNVVHNRGDIYGKVDGVSFNGINNSLVNEGRIRADIGLAAGEQGGNGVVSGGDNTAIFNTGSITTLSTTGSGVRVGSIFSTGGDGSLVENHGEIIATRSIGVDFSLLIDSDSATLKNFGLISGGRFGFLGGDAVDEVINGGEIHGGVGLGAGDDVYQARKDGRVEGSINGGSGNDTMTGGAKIDKLSGNSGNDQIVGRAGDDLIKGDGGNDRLRGQGDDDTLIGGNGNDTLNGGRGDDTLNGGGGADTFIFGLDAGNDTITFFKNGTDLIDLTAYDLRPNQFAAIRDAISDADGGDTFLDLADIGGTGSVFINGLGITEVNVADFLF